MMKLPLHALPTLLLAQFSAVPAYAQDADQAELNAFDLSATLTAVSDYRFRGLSLSNRDPALQGSIDISHSSGVYAGVWGSSLAEYGGAKVEVDATLGWRGDVGPVTLDVGGTAYLYPGGTGVNVVEGFGYISKSIGPAQIRAGAAYAPKQSNLGGNDNLYLTADARVGIPSTPVTLTGSLGHERGAFAGPTGRKWDWSLGAKYAFSPVTLGVSYADTNIRSIDDPTGNSKAGLFASASIEF
jgi:uncharacterized protein (TIGR02001 family)